MFYILNFKMYLKGHFLMLNHLVYKVKWHVVTDVFFSAGVGRAARLLLRPVEFTS